MKSTRTGQKWAHVSCALWIPEVSIGCVEKMEPITKISSIPVRYFLHKKIVFDCFLFSAIPMVPDLCSMQGADGFLHPMQCKDLQDCLSRNLRLQTQPGDARHHRGRECGGWC